MQWGRKRNLPAPLRSNNPTQRLPIASICLYVDFYALSVPLDEQRRTSSKIRRIMTCAFRSLLYHYHYKSKNHPPKSSASSKPLEPPSNRFLPLLIPTQYRYFAPYDTQNLVYSQGRLGGILLRVSPIPDEPSRSTQEVWQRSANSCMYRRALSTLLSVSSTILGSFLFRQCT